MSDDLKKRGLQDRVRINVNEDWEVREWSAHFGCTEAELRAAVREVGVMVADVRRYFLARR
ncbi:DUF3606 domain-containing protein [Corallococcus carmarthensis]|uniref:DUF3606 domain-containing protein n=1 Tax=Corallococcus carmarthensis TaxID=2316728 RepID=A0A3A8JTA2_9BACT|nr:DUF3606 domain-containing protein [Corallococcus carmarthensis]NOK19372.1 DUF3606 domain-containing protein [Corallococcus carmarthensis]RKG98148.1 DUF3606 domain-containing protein [Corallococcus carmarthensis]